MTFTSVLLFCIGGIAACAALVFVVETLVAFCLQERETVAPRGAKLLSFDQPGRDITEDKAA
jgi:hypothetical protein